MKEPSPLPRPTEHTSLTSVLLLLQKRLWNKNGTTAALANQRVSPIKGDQSGGGFGDESLIL